jgi:hypothetical protein
MKSLLAICLIVAASFATALSAGEHPALVPSSAAKVTGEVLEVKDVDSYTYLRLKTRDGETWAAVNKTPVKKGAKVTIENVMVMNNFESKTLKKTFPTILFGNLGGTGDDLTGVHAGVAATMDTGSVHIPKASGANARTVAEIVTKAADLKDKPVRVRGKIVKYNPEIMGKNWIHLRDGSGKAADNTNEVLVTSMGQAKTGDIVTVTGVVRTNKDFSAGYSYKVLIEEASLQP